MNRAGSGISHVATLVAASTLSLSPADVNIVEDKRGRRKCGEKSTIGK